MKTYLNQIHGSSRLFLPLWQSLFLFPAQFFSHQYIIPCSFPSCWLTSCPWPSGFFQALDSDCTSVKVTRAFFYQQIGKGNGCSSFWFPFNNSLYLEIVEIRWFATILHLHDFLNRLKTLLSILLLQQIVI